MPSLGSWRQLPASISYFALSFAVLTLFPALISAQNASPSSAPPRATTTAIKTTVTTVTDSTSTAAPDNTDPSTQDSSSSSSDLSKKLVWIIPAAVGGAIFLIVFILLCCCCMRRRNRRKRASQIEWGPSTKDRLSKPEPHRPIGKRISRAWASLRRPEGRYAAGQAPAQTQGPSEAMTQRVFATQEERPMNSINNQSTHGAYARPGMRTATGTGGYPLNVPVTPLAAPSPAAAQSTYSNYNSVNSSTYGQRPPMTAADYAAQPMKRTSPPVHPRSTTYSDATTVMMPSPGVSSQPSRPERTRPARAGGPRQPSIDLSTRRTDTYNTSNLNTYDTSSSSGPRRKRNVESILRDFDSALESIK